MPDNICAIVMYMAQDPTISLYCSRTILLDSFVQSFILMLVTVVHYSSIIVNYLCYQCQVLQINQIKTVVIDVENWFAAMDSIESNDVKVYLNALTELHWFLLLSVEWYDFRSVWNVAMFPSNPLPIFFTFSLLFLIRLQVLSYNSFFAYNLVIL